MATSVLLVPVARTRLSRALLAAAALWLMAAAASAQNADYIVGAQDVLNITVWDQADLSGKYTVETDGTFTFPMIGRVKAGGLTLRKLEEALKEKLADGYFKNPQVSVAVEQYRSQRIIILGEVRNPGSYPLTGDMTIIEALAHAGSLSGEASQDAIIVRAPLDKHAAAPNLSGQQEETSEVIRVDVKQLESGSLAQNVRLRDGDTIFVTRAETLYVFGQVKSPGAYPVQRGMTVLQALSLAGGVTDRGSTSRLSVIRMVKGKKTEVKVKLDDLVQPGDTLMVRERFF